MNKHFHLEPALSRVLGDKELLKEVIQEFLTSAPLQLAHVEHAVGIADAAALAKTAHLLKSSIGTLSTGPLFETALTLERLGKEGDLDQAPSQFRFLKSGLDELLVELKAYREGA